MAKILTAEEILAKHSKNYGMFEANPRAIVKASEAIKAMEEYAKLCVEAAKKTKTNKKPKPTQPLKSDNQNSIYNELRWKGW